MANGLHDKYQASFKDSKAQPDANCAREKEGGFWGRYFCVARLVIEVTVHARRCA